MKTAAKPLKAEKRPPLRTCLVCRQKRAKGELTRFVLSEEGLRVEDQRQRMPGRGYYVCAGGECREQWLRRKPGGRAKRGRSGAASAK